MTGLVRESLVRAFRISIVGVTVGGVAAIASFLAAATPQAVATVIGLIFWALAVLPTATLLVMSLNDIQASEYHWYRSASTAVGMPLLANVIGAVLAMLFFYVLVTGAPILLRGLEANALRQAVVQEIGLLGPIIVLAAATIGALGVGTWARQQSIA